MTIEERAEKLAHAIAAKSGKEVAMAGGGFEDLPPAAKVAMMHGVTIQRLAEVLADAMRLREAHEDTFEYRCTGCPDCSSSCDLVKQAIAAHDELFRDLEAELEKDDED